MRVVLFFSAEGSFCKVLGITRIHTRAHALQGESSMKSDVKKCIKIEIPEARNLPSADSNGLSDPFFWLYYNNARE
jgi:Ca2+-dependent lipid-binding protein